MLTQGVMMTGMESQICHVLTYCVTWSKLHNLCHAFCSYPFKGIKVSGSLPGSIESMQVMIIIDT